MVDLPTGFGNPNWLSSGFLTGTFGEGLPGLPWGLSPMKPDLDQGAFFTKPPPVEGGFRPDWYNKEYAAEYPVWQPGAFSPPPSEAILPSQSVTDEQLALAQGGPGYGPRPEHKYWGPPPGHEEDISPYGEALNIRPYTQTNPWQETYRDNGGPPPSDQILPSRPTSNEILPQSRFQADILGGTEIPLIGGFGPGVDPGEVGLGMFSRGEAILPSQSNEILPQPPERPLPPLQQTRFSRFPSDPFMRYQDSTQDMLGGTGMHPSHGLLGKAETQIYPEVSGEQAAAVPIDPADLVGGSFFSGPNQTGGPAIPGSGYRYSDNVLKGAAGGPFSELGALSREGADWQKKVGPTMTAAVGSQIPGASILGLLGAGLNKLGAYHRFNPAADSNLFADPETGRATWGTTDPGGSGSQRGTLNLYNMLQDYGGSYPTRQVQTPSRTIYHDDGSSTVVPQYANARDLAYIMGRGDRPPPGLYTQQTPLGYQDFGEDTNVTNQEALIDYNRTGSGAILNQAGAILGPNAGYNETRDLAASMADDLQDQMDYSDQDWGDWI